MWVMTPSYNSNLTKVMKNAYVVVYLIEIESMQNKVCSVFVKLVESRCVRFYSIIMLSK